MAILAKLFQAFRPQAAQSILADPSHGYQRAYWLNPPAGIRLNEQESLEISTVWACVDSISKALASCFWRVTMRDANDRKQTLYDDPLSYLLNVQPNDDMTAISFREAMLICALTWGNGYAEIGRDGANRAVSLLPLEPDRVVAKRLGREENYRLVYEYTNPWPANNVVTLQSKDVFHLHGPGISGLMGDNMAAKMSKAIGLAAAAERFASTYFGNNTIVGGVLETDRILNNETHERMRKDWDDIHKGPQNAHKVAILENGLKFHHLDANADKAQLVESRKFQVEEICFVPGTQIITSTGLKAIERIQRGELVLTHRGRWRRVSNTMSRQYEGRVVTTKTKTLEPVTATSNHPFFAQKIKPSRTHSMVNDGELSWIAAGDLVPSTKNAAGDRSRRAFHSLAMPKLEQGNASIDLADWAAEGAVTDGSGIKASENHRATNVTRKPAVDYSLGWLCGLFVADGSSTDHQVVFYLGAHEESLTDELHTRLGAAFGVEGSTTITDGGVARTVVSNRVLARFFSQFGHASHEKRLPEWCLSGPSEFRAGLLEGLVDGDGCSGHGYTMLRTTSLDLAWQTRLLLWTKEINGTLIHADEKEWSIEGRSGAAREIWTVQWRTDPVRRGVMGLSGDSVTFSLDGVEVSDYSGVVYNIEVEEDESYTTVGGVVHNCRFYGVPPHKVMHLERSTNNNIEHQGIEWVRDGLTPWARRLEQEANRKLIPARGGKRATLLDTAWLSMGDYRSRAEGYRIMRETGVYSVNEIREKEGDNDIGPDGDIRIVPLNMQTYKQLELAEERAEVDLENAENPPEPSTPLLVEEEKPAEIAEPKPKPLATADSLLRDAVSTLFASVFDRYQRRLENREADLSKRWPKDRVDQSLAIERERLRPWLLEECAPAVALADKVRGETADMEPGLLRAADLLDNGETPETVALQVVMDALPLPVSIRIAV